MEKELVLLDGNKVYTTTIIIAEGCQVEHRATMQLLKRHKNRKTLSSFETKKISRGGRPIEYAILSGKQACFLIMLMKNSPQIVIFKEKLIKSFLLNFNQGFQALYDGFVNCYKKDKDTDKYCKGIVDNYMRLAIKNGINVDYISEKRDNLYQLFIQYIEKYGWLKIFEDINSDNKTTLKKGYIYAIQRPNGNIKIGRTITPEQRLRCLETQGGFNAKDIFVSEAIENYASIERKLLKKFKSSKLIGEWFDASFNDVIAEIKNATS